MVEMIDGKPVGWRFWNVAEGHDGLLSPYERKLHWPGPVVNAVCPLGHRPPEKDCHCGIYAWQTAANCVYRGRQHHTSWRHHRGVRQHLVIGRVLLHGWAPFVPEQEPDKTIIQHGAGLEWRAASAKVLSLFVMEDGTSVKPEALAARLAARYQVPVRVVRR